MLHSFRIWAATEAARLGLGEGLIKKIGRWKSESFLLYMFVLTPLFNDLQVPIKLFGLLDIPSWLGQARELLRESILKTWV